MSLEPISEMMRHARSHDYAVGYFESWNIDSLYGVIDAAEQMKSPVLIGFNGEFLSHAGRVETERLALYGALGKAAAASASVPCGFIFNECAQDEWTRNAITSGFNLVMPADPDAAPADYMERVSAIAQLAHANSVAVEAEIGELPSGVPGEEDHTGSETSAEDAKAFVAETGIDLLAVSVGNVHIALSGAHGLDLARLAEIHAAVDVPLVLHGGTGIAPDHLVKAISLGVTKVNYGTYIKQRYLVAVRSAINSDEPNPHALIGLGGPQDILVVGRKAVREAVLERLPLLNSAGKA
jgi:ketose-bisphosphate aldolase